MKISARVIFAMIVFLFLPLSAGAQAPDAFLILSPAPGEVISGDTVRFEARLPEGFTLMDPDAHPEHAQWQGHLRVWLNPFEERPAQSDRAIIQESSDLNAVGTAPRYDNATSIVLKESAVYEFKNIFSGLHTIYAELYHNDGRRYDPPLADAVDFETFSSMPDNQDNGDEPPVAPPIATGGLFLPPGGGNTLLVIFLIGAATGILWYLSRRRNSTGA